MLVKDFLRQRRDYDCTYVIVKSLVVIPSQRRHAATGYPFTLSAAQKNVRSVGPLYTDAQSGSGASSSCPPNGMGVGRQSAPLNSADNFCGTGLSGTFAG